jgi:hypothetical protein
VESTAPLALRQMAPISPSEQAFFVLASGDAMDLNKVIRDLYAQKESLTRAISMLEELQGSSGGASPPRMGSRRGRKSMGLKERQEVSARMKKYWASRRKGRHPGTD